MFLLGFANSEQADIGSDELAELKRRGSGVLETAVEALETMIADDEILEVHYGGSAES